MDIDFSHIYAMVQAGAEINVADLQSRTPVQLAASKGNARVLDLFLRKGKHLEMDVVDDNGWTALHHAAYGGNDKCCELLLNEGASKDITDNKGRRALDLARHLDYGDCVAQLEDVRSRIAFEMGEHFD